MNFSLEQLAGFMGLLNLLLENLNKHMTLGDNIKELGRTMAGIGGAHSEESGDLFFFSIEQAKAVIDYLNIRYYIRESEGGLEEPSPEAESKADALTDFTVEDVKSVMGEITNEIIGNLEINKKLQIQEEAYTSRIEKLKRPI
uniref:Uncharacterized protein n=1 Tax=Nothoprocta perdicaria TaxID=30464 RepID=A0A8C6YL47_NOTPE